MIRCVPPVSLLAVALLAGCGDAPSVPLRAFRAKLRSELVGGPVAYADVNDFVLENDKVRVAILDEGRSWGPGVFGGSLVDADVRRDDPLTPSGAGRDRFVEMFPFANLLVPAPVGTQVRVEKDGSDGKEAVIRVEGDGRYMFEAMAVLRNYRPLGLDQLFATVRTAIRFRTDYLLRPGDAHVTMRTWLLLGAEPEGTVPAFACKEDLGCETGHACVEGFCACKPLTCPTACPPAIASDKDSGRAFDPATGCLACACAPEPLKMPLTDGDESVFGTILGDDEFSAKRKLKAGVGAGDFVFFGNQNDIFVPGHGFDEEKPIWDALFTGRDTFHKPLAFDFVAAAGGDVSYAYFQKRAAAADVQPKVLVPIFTSAATAFISATLNCVWDAADDAACETARVYEFERYLAIGNGDIGAVADTVWRVRGTATGRVEGWVRWKDTGAAATKAGIFVLRQPVPGRAWPSLDALVAANRAVDGSPGVVLAWDADVGLDRQLDARFGGTLPAGNYVVVAMDEHRVVHSVPLSVEVTAESTLVVAPALPTPARVKVRAVDQGGAGVPSKATLVRLGDDGKPLFRDGGRRPYLGQGRLGAGVQHIAFGMDGRFDIAVPAGRYQLVVSRGVEYGIHDTAVDLADGDVTVITALLRREVDTAGWVAGDFHLHAEPSFDSGMPLSQRVRTVAAEGLDYVASTDHDVASDYAPWVKTLGLGQWLKTAVGSEVSTLEIGHFIGFPLAYDALQVPHHASVDWFCKGSDGIFDSILAQTGLPAGGRPTSIVAHPRDGFLGWAEQAEINAYSMTRTPVKPSDPPGNPVLRTVGCDFDAMEVFNGKRFDLIQTPTVREVQVFWRCMHRIDSLRIESAPGVLDEAATRTALAATCPELADDPIGDPARVACPASEPLPECTMRVRMAVARAVSTQILQRTPAEQTAWLRLVEGLTPTKAHDKVVDLERFCNVNTGKGSTELSKPLDQVVPPDQQDLPCTRWVGSLSDYFRMLEHGFVKTQVGGSDSHGYKVEPGAPRTWVRSSRDAAGDVDPTEIAKNLRAGQAIASYGPFIDVRIAGKGPGETVAVKAGSLTVHVKVQTASWFGVNRIEIYRSGELVVVEPVVTPVSAIVDVDKDYAIDIPAGRDAWLVVVAMGTDGERLLRPVYLDIPFGELQLARVTALALKNITLPVNPFKEPPRVPDFSPVYPYGMTNAVLIDVNGNGKYDAPLPFPGFCSQACDAVTGKTAAGKLCSELQQGYTCLKTEKKCGFDIPGVCDIYKQAASKAAVGRTLP